MTGLKEEIIERGEPGMHFAFIMDKLSQAGPEIPTSLDVCYITILLSMHMELDMRMFPEPIMRKTKCLLMRYT